MTTELAIIAPELKSVALTVIPGIAQETMENLKTEFSPLFNEAEAWRKKAADIFVSDISQTREMKLAREIRLALREIRIKGRKVHDAMKEESLRKGKAIDLVNNGLEGLISPIEEHLLNQEKFVERQQEAMKAERKARREEALAPYGLDTTWHNLREMPEETFAELLANTKAAHEAKIEAQRKAEQDRIARERAEEIERKRVLAENARLAQEAREREKQMEAEREAARLERVRLMQEREAERVKAEQEAAQQEAARKAELRRIEAERAKEREAMEARAKAAADKARKEKEAAEAKATQERAALEAKARIEREAAEKAADLQREEFRKQQAVADAKAKAEREKFEAERKRQRETVEKAESELAARRAQEKADADAKRQAEEKARLAPDKAKLLTLAGEIRGIALPSMSTPRGADTLAKITVQREKLAAWIEKVSENIDSEDLF
jgi:hypothetical protein